MKILLLYTLLFSWQISFSQDIIEFFQMVPDSAVFNLSTSERKRIAINSKENKSFEDAFKVMNKTKSNYAFETVNKSKTYLKLIGAFEGQFQMSFWNLPNGNLMLAIYKESCGPVCYVDSFIFYEFDGVKFKHLPFETIITLEGNDFLKEDKIRNIEAMESQDIIATLLFQLPENGEAILVKWDNEATTEVYRKYAKGNTLKLKWQHGKFSKSKIFWN